MATIESATEARALTEFLAPYRDAAAAGGMKVTAMEGATN
jgi:hypothetical protein